MTTPEAIRLLERWAEARPDEPDFQAAVRHAVIAMRILANQAELTKDLPGR